MASRRPRAASIPTPPVDRRRRQGGGLRRRAEPRILDCGPRLAFQPADAGREGEWPGPKEVVVDKETAGKEDFEVETIRIRPSPVQHLQDLRDHAVQLGLSIGGATLAGFDLPTAQRLMRKEGSPRRDRGGLETGCDRRRARAGDQPILPEGTKVQGVGEQVQSDAERRTSSSRSCRASCSPSAASRSSSARSSSRTRCRSSRSAARGLATLRMLGVAAAGPHLDHPRGARRRGDRLRDRSLPRPTARQGAVLALRRGRLHAPEHGSRFRDAHVGPWPSSPESS